LELTGGELWLARRRKATAQVGDPLPEDPIRVELTTKDGAGLGHFRLGRHVDGSALRPDELAAIADVTAIVVSAIRADSMGRRAAVTTSTTAS
jgi:hypothetical protein